MRIDEVMTTRVVTVPPHLLLKHLARLLLAHDVSGAPVVEDGRVVGVISESDLVRLEAREESGPSRRLLRGRRQPGKVARVVADAMTSPALTIEPWMSVGAAAATMIASDVNRLPVVRDGRLVGIVARADLVRAFARSDEEIRGEIEQQVVAAFAPEDDVGVSVHEGEVQLEPRMELDAEALARDVRSVAGVVGVRVTTPPGREETNG